MKVYIFTDLEGATGVVNYDYGDAQRRKKDREFLANDINAAIAGAFDADAEAVVVCDGHGRDAVNLDKLDPRSTLIKQGGVESYLPGFSAQFTHSVLIGLHSMAGTGGILSHTYSPRVRRIVLNGFEIGEIGLCFTFSSWFGRKPVFISGDDKAIAEAKRYLSDIEGVAVKTSISETCAECFSPKITYPMIREGVKKALITDQCNSPEIPTPPYTMEVTYKRPLIALIRYLIKSHYDGVRLKNLYTIRYEDDGFPQIMNKFIGTYKMVKKSQEIHKGDRNGPSRYHL